MHTWISLVRESSRENQKRSRAPFIVAHVSPGAARWIREGVCAVWRGHHWRPQYRLNTLGAPGAPARFIAVIEFCPCCGASRRRPPTYSELVGIDPIAPDAMRRPACDCQ